MQISRNRYVRKVTETLKLGELVAIKRFNHDLGDDLMTKSIIREITILRSVHHENIVLFREAFRKYALGP
jgi:serine/threonine protein kinase